MYFTNDGNGDGTITESAVIFEATSKAAAYEAVRSQYEDGGWKGLNLTEGRFSDCWEKFSANPSDLDCHDPFTLDQLIIQKPGSHPGGQTFWVTPMEPVWVFEPVEEGSDTDVEFSL